MNNNDTMQEMDDKINHCVVALNNFFSTSPRTGYLRINDDNNANNSP